jgi:hypothetical protein
VWSRRIAWLASVVTLASLLILPWWPGDFNDPLFLEYRGDPLEWHATSGGYMDRWYVIPLNYFRFGYLLHLAAAVAAPITLARESRWHWLTLAIAVTTVWEFTAVVPFGLINTTIVPYLPMIAGLVTCVCWVVARVDLYDKATSDV